MDQLAGLTEEVRKLALDRFRLLQPHLEDDRPLKAVAMSAGIPFRTAQRWVSLYRQFGLTALAQKRRTDTGQHREMSAKLKEALEGIALQKPPIPVTAISRQARRLAQDLGEEPPSYWVVYRIVAALPRCPPIWSHSPMRGRKRIATHSSWCTGEKRIGPTRSGKPIIPRSTFCWSAPTVRLPSRRSPP